MEWSIEIGHYCIPKIEYIFMHINSSCEEQFNNNRLIENNLVGFLILIFDGIHHILSGQAGDK